MNLCRDRRRRRRQSAPPCARFTPDTRRDHRYVPNRPASREERDLRAEDPPVAASVRLACDSGRIRVSEIALLCCILATVLVLLQVTASSDRERPTNHRVDSPEAVATEEISRESDVAPSPETRDARFKHAERPRYRQPVPRSLPENRHALRRGVGEATTQKSGVSKNGAEGSIVPVEASEEILEEDTGEDESEDPEDEKPPASLSGWVFDEVGEGVAELGVVATVKRPVPEDGMSSGAARSAAARSDGEGFFVLPGLVEGEYEVRTESTDRYESASGLFRAGVDSAVLVVFEKDRRWAIVRGFVESADGGSLENAQVVPIGQAEHRVLTDGRGAYELTVELDTNRRPRVIRYASKGHRDLRLTIADSELRGSQEVVRNVLLEPLREKSTVTGTVVSSDGSPVDRARVQLYSADTGRRADGVSDDAGRFSITDVEHAEDYRVWVRPPSGFKDYLEEGLVVTGWVDLHIVLEDLEDSGLKGQMVDPVGVPVPRFTLWLRTASESALNPRPVTGDDLGQFFVSHLPEGPVALQTQSSPFLTVSGIELLPGIDNHVRLRLDTGNHRLGGYVFDGEDRPVAGARILLLWSAMESGIQSQSKRETYSDANGYFLFTRLGSAWHTLTVSAQGFTGARLEHDVGPMSEEVLIHLEETPL